MTIERGSAAGRAEDAACSLPGTTAVIYTGIYYTSLMARLDRLAPVKEIGQIGAAIGREFSYSLMRAVVGRDETALNDALAKLEQAEHGRTGTGTLGKADIEINECQVRL